MLVRFLHTLECFVWIPCKWVGGLLQVGIQTTDDDAGIPHHSISTFPPYPASWVCTAFTSATRRASCPGLGKHTGGNGDGIGAGGGQGGWNQHHGSHRHPGGQQMSPQHQGGGGGGSSGGGGGGKNDHGAADYDIVDTAAGGAAAGTTCGGRIRLNSLRTSSDQGKRSGVG